MRRLNNVWLFCMALFGSPVFAGIFSFCIYTIFATQRGSITGTSSSPYFNYLADAFIHGRLSLRIAPPNLHDLAFFNGQAYMYWPPFPAILLMPFIAVFGVGFSDVFFTLVIGAVNVALVAYFLRLLDKQNLVPLDGNQRGLFTIFFAFGTVHLLLSSLGIVWFTSQIIAFLCSILAFLAAIRLKGYPAFFLTGLALACATLTRNHLIFLGIWLAWFLIQAHRPASIKKIFSYLLVAALPILVGVLLNFLYNYFRFGNIFEYGLTYQKFGDFFEPDFLKYGHFNIHYLATNFYFNFIYYPFPTSDTALMGGSLFLLSPLFFASFWALSIPKFRTSAIVLWLSVIAVTIPILLNIGTGWKTFGPRYTLDFAVPLLLLTAMGIHKWPKWLILILILISIIHYIMGTLFFIRVT